MKRILAFASGASCTAAIFRIHFYPSRSQTLLECSAAVSALHIILCSVPYPRSALMAGLYTML